MGWLSNHDGRFMGRSHLVQHCTRHFPLRSPGQELQSQESSLAQLAAPMIHSDLLHCCICCTWYCLLFRHKICALHRTRIFSGNMSCDVMFCDWRFLASPRKKWAFCPTANTSSAALKLLLAASNWATTWVERWNWKDQTAQHQRRLNGSNQISMELILPE